MSFFSNLFNKPPAQPAYFPLHKTPAENSDAVDADAEASGEAAGATADTTAQTREEASGVEAYGDVGAEYIYYDLHGQQFVIVNEAVQVNIVNEDRFLNTAIEELHDANAALEAARSECLKAIDEAPSPAQVDPALYDRLTAYFDEARRVANEKRKLMDEIHNSLDGLDDTEKPDKTKPLHQVAAIREFLPAACLRGGGHSEDKVRYIRPSVAFAEANGEGDPKWHQLSVSEEEVKSFITKDGFNKDAFQKQLKDLVSLKSVDISKDFSDILPEKLQMKSDFLYEFAKNWSEALQYDSDKACDEKYGAGSEQCEQRVFSCSGAAQFLRYTHGVGIKGSFDLKSMRANIKAEGRAELALLEAKGRFQWRIPDRRGWMLSLPARDGVNADLGLIRFLFGIQVSGFVGASLAGEVSINVDPKGLIRGRNGGNDNPAPEPMGNRFDFDSMDKNHTARGDVAVRAFVGAEGTGEFDFAVQWKNPEKHNDYAAFAKYLIGVSAQAGIGVEAKFKIGYQEKVGFYIEARAGLCFGYGAKGSMKLNIDALLIGEFMLWFVYQLRNVDFKYIRDLIDDREYEQLCLLQYLLIGGTYAMQGIQVGLLALDKLRKDYGAYRDRIRLMNRILEEDRGLRQGHEAEQVRHAAPEVKGNILWLLTDNSYWDHIGWDAQMQNPLTGEAWLFGSHKWLKRAVVAVLLYCQSKAEYRNVMQHMSQKMGEKGDWQANERRLKKFLDAGEINFWLFQWMSTDYDGSFEKWLEDLDEGKQQAYRQDVECGNTFYAYLPEGTSPGTTIDESIQSNLMYASGSGFTPPVYIAAAFTDCHAPDVWGDDTLA